MEATELKELLASVGEAQKAVMGFVEVHKQQQAEIKNVGASSEAAALEVKKAEARITQLSADIEGLKSAYKARIDDLQERLDEYDSKASDANRQPAIQSKSIAERFVEDENVKGALQRIVDGERGVAASVKYAGGIASSTSLPDRIKAVFSQPELVEVTRLSGILSFMNEARHVPDFIPTRPLRGSNTVEWLQTNLFDVAAGSGLTIFGAAGMVADGDTKPEAKYGAEELTRSVKTIAHHINITKQTARDHSQIVRQIETDLLQGLANRKDQQLLYGVGTGANISGITSYGISTYAWSDGVVGDTRIDALRRALTLVYADYHVPTGIMISHEEWENIQLTKSADDGHYLMVNLHQGGLAGTGFFAVPVMPTNIVAANSALVGAWATAATIWQAENASLRVSEHHDQNFIKNLLTLLAEEALLLQVTRPEAFCEVDFDEAPS